MLYKDKLSKDLKSLEDNYTIYYTTKCTNTLYNGKYPFKVTFKSAKDQMIVTWLQSGDTNGFYYENEPLIDDDMMEDSVIYETVKKNRKSIYRYDVAPKNHFFSSYDEMLSFIKIFDDPRLINIPSISLDIRFPEDEEKMNTLIDHHKITSKKDEQDNSFIKIKHQMKKSPNPDYNCRSVITFVPTDTNKDEIVETIDLINSSFNTRAVLNDGQHGYRLMITDNLLKNWPVPFRMYVYLEYPEEALTFFPYLSKHIKITKTEVFLK